MIVTFGGISFILNGCLTKMHANENHANIPSHRIVSFMQAVKYFFKNYFHFHGRSSRGAYWWWFLASILIIFIASISDALIFSVEGPTPISNVFSLATFIPSISLSVRRLHDIGRSGWWYLLVFTIIGIPLILYWAARPGSRNVNTFGPDKEAGTETSTSYNAEQKVEPKTQPTKSNNAEPKRKEEHKPSESNRSAEKPSAQFLAQINKLPPDLGS